MQKLENIFKENELKLIEKVLETGRKTSEGKPLKWFDLAQEFNIKPFGTHKQRRTAANDVWRKYKKKTFHISSTPKRLFYDIETSYNIVKSWRVGYNLRINPEDILQERAIICVSYKWEGDKKVYTLTWNNGNDSKLVKEFLEVLQEADEIVGHNIDRFDTKFLLTRAIKHGVYALPKYSSFDTLKIARRHFNFNSNKLDYIANFLGLGRKLQHRGMEMWDDIILNNCPVAMAEMVEYCEKDVVLTEEVFKKLRSYTEQKIHHGVLNLKPKHSCPECSSTETQEFIKKTVTKRGLSKVIVRCPVCNTQHIISEKQYLKQQDGQN